MGIQIQIERDVLEKAGWKCRLQDDYANEYDDDGYVVSETNYPYLLIEKDGYVFASYFPDVFVADCNHWGSSRAQFIAAGLFDLEHIES